MWKFLQTLRKARHRNGTQQERGEPGMSEISAVELASLFDRARDNLMVFDVRESAEIEADPCAIEGALLTFNVNLRRTCSLDSAGDCRRPLWYFGYSLTLWICSSPFKKIEVLWVGWRTTILAGSWPPTGTCSFRCSEVV